MNLAVWKNPEAEVEVEQDQNVIHATIRNSVVAQTTCEQPRDLMAKDAKLLKVDLEKSVPVMLCQLRNLASTARKRNSVVAPIQRLQLPDQILLDATYLVQRPNSVAVMTTSLQPMVPKRKVVASTLNSAVVRTISVPQLDLNSKDATVNSLNSAAVLITSLQPVARNLKDADVSTPNTPAVLIATLQLLDPTIKDADVTHSNLVAVLILSLWPKDPILRVADVKKLLMDAAKMNEHPPMDRNSKAVLLNLLNMVVVMTESFPHKDPTMKDVHRNLNFLAVYLNLRCPTVSLM